MKKVLAFASLLGLVACNFPVGELPQIHGAIEAQTWVYQHIQYKTDQELYGRQEYWAYPEETLANGAGDCEDMAILFAAIVAQDGGNPELALLDLGGGDLHMAAEVDGVRYMDAGYETRAVVHTWTWAKAQDVTIRSHAGRGM
jgi:hypothetical protein